MFRSGGYFKGVPCPFYLRGGCARVHCPFRHAKTASGELGAVRPVLWALHEGQHTWAGGGARASANSGVRGVSLVQPSPHCPPSALAPSSAVAGSSALATALNTAVSCLVYVVQERAQ